MMRTLVYDAALVIIAATAIGAVLHPRVQTGILGSIALAGIAVFTVAGVEYEPANWRLGQVLAAAALCLWLVCRFWWRRAKMRKRLLRLCNACPLHEDR